MKKLVGTLLVFLLAVPVLAQTDEDIAFESIFAYFPDGIYQSFGFFNMKAAREAPVFPVFEKLGSEADGLLVNTLPPLPESFIKAADYIVSASLESPRAVKLKQSIEEKAREVRTLAGNKKKIDQDTRDELQSLGNKMRELKLSGSLWSVYVPESSALIDEALEAGYFAETGDFILERPVYDVRVKSGTNNYREGQKAFAYLTGDGELLVVLDKENIGLMLDCASGKSRSVIDNQDYVAALSRVDKTHQGWNVEPKRAAKLRTIDTLTQTGEDEERLLELEETVREGLVTEVQSVLMNEEMVVRKVAEYTTEEEAEEAYKQMQQGFSTAKESISSARKSVREEQDKLSPQEQRIARNAMGFANNLINSNKITRDETLVVTDVIFGKKQLATLSMLLDFAKMMEEKERAKEEADKN